MGQCPLPVLEDAPDLRRQDEPGRDLSQYPPPQLAFNPVADDGPRDAIARFGEHLVAVVPAAKGALDLDVGEVTVPLEFGDAGEPSHTKGIMQNEVSISVPTPATCDGSDGASASNGGSTSRRFSMRVPVDGGMRQARFSGLAKNRNTRSSGNGTQSSNTAR
jgi:hypothetical protein